MSMASSVVTRSLPDLVAGVLALLSTDHPLSTTWAPPLPTTATYGPSAGRNTRRAIVNVVRYQGEGDEYRRPCDLPAAPGLHAVCEYRTPHRDQPDAL